MDGGIRSGVDVLRAVALGADAVLLGRPVLRAPAVSGEDGVRRLLDLLAAEIRDAFGLAGCHTIDDARNLTTSVRQ
ncbi:alpha-hydroxy-acid oxidizing protein [Streptomyces sp. NPDC058653]|uniref:alpha-hydroxy-acid oxidizing protein n=1 Tax=Streptomyces sp. NPDC058653 TaxID=3346576 RepID=UPI00364E2E9D